MDKGSYKGFSGRYGSYAQKGGAASMLRLRMTAGCVEGEACIYRKGNPCISGKYGTFYDL